MNDPVVFLHAMRLIGAGLAMIGRDGPPNASNMDRTDSVGLPSADAS